MPATRKTEAFVAQSPAPRAWPWLLAAGVTETGWVEGIAHAATLGQWSATFVLLLASLGLALGAARALPSTTVYVLFVALGTVGTTVFEAFAAAALPDPWVIFWLVALLCGIAGLQRADHR